MIRLCGLDFLKTGSAGYLREFCNDPSGNINTETRSLKLSHKVLLRRVSEICYDHSYPWLS